MTVTPRLTVEVTCFRCTKPMAIGTGGSVLAVSNEDASVFVTRVRACPECCGGLAQVTWSWVPDTGKRTE